MKILSSFNWRETKRTVVTALAAFLVYSCMYAFRKPFTAGNFDDQVVFGVHFKIWLVIAQTIGYTLSKFIGISFIGSLKPENRGRQILFLIGIAWVALFFFGLCPAPYNIIFIFLNGLPLGMIYGLVFSYLEGRRSTEFLGATLSASFIFASGFAQSIGKYILINWKINEYWMPWYTGLLFFPVLIVAVAILDRTPDPDQQDRKYRTQRSPMDKKERKRFISFFFPGLVMLVLSYVLLTVIRDYRSNFASNMWQELGRGNDAGVFTKTEIPISIAILFLMAFLGFIRNNKKAFYINHLVIIGGFLISLLSTWLFQQGKLEAYWWLTLTGMGLYISYVPFNCMLFDRLIASFRYVSNAGFIIYIADSFGYLGSDLVLVFKNFMPNGLNWTNFFVAMIPICCLPGIFLTTASYLYFRNKHSTQNFQPKASISYV